MASRARPLATDTRLKTSSDMAELLEVVGAVQVGVQVAKDGIPEPVVFRPLHSIPIEERALRFLPYPDANPVPPHAEVAKPSYSLTHI